MFVKMVSSNMLTMLTESFSFLTDTHMSFRLPLLVLLNFELLHLLQLTLVWINHSSDTGWGKI